LREIKPVKEFSNPATSLVNKIKTSLLQNSRGESRGRLLNCPISLKWNHTKQSFITTSRVVSSMSQTGRKHIVDTLQTIINMFNKDTILEMLHSSSSKRMYKIASVPCTIAKRIFFGRIFFLKSYAPWYYSKKKNSARVEIN